MKSLKYTLQNRFITTHPRIRHGRIQLIIKQQQCNYHKKGRNYRCGSIFKHSGATHQELLDCYDIEMPCIRPAFLISHVLDINDTYGSGSCAILQLRFSSQFYTLIPTCSQLVLKKITDSGFSNNTFSLDFGQQHYESKPPKSAQPRASNALHIQTQSPLTLHGSSTTTTSNSGLIVFVSNSQHIAPF